MNVVTLWPGILDNGSRVTVYASDLVTLIPTSGAFIDSDAPDWPYYAKKLRKQELLSYDPVDAGGTPIDLVIPTVQVVGGPGAIGDVLVLQNPPTTAEFQPDPGNNPGVLVSELSTVAVVSDGQPIVCSGKDTRGDGYGGLFSGILGGAGSTTEDGINIVHSGLNAWERFIALSQNSLPSADSIIAEPGAPNQVVLTSGWDASGNAEDLYLRWSTTPATVDGVDIFSTFASGSWRRVDHGGARSALSMPGLVGDGIADDTLAMQALLTNAMRGAGAACFIPPGTYRITDTLVIDNADIGQSIEFYCTGGGASAGAPARLIYQGTHTDRPLLSIRARDVTFKHLSFTCGATRTMPRLVEFLIGATGTSTGPRFESCAFGVETNGLCEYGFEVPSSVVQNCEEGTFEHCVFANFQEASVRLAGGQPYAFSFNKCTFVNNFGSVARGRAFLLQAQSCSLNIHNPTIGRLSVFLDIQNIAGISVTGYTDSENCKRLIQSSFSLNSGRPLTWLGGRLANTQYGLAAEYPTIAADDNRYILHQLAGMPLMMQGVSFSEGSGLRPDFSITAQWAAPIELDGCTFPLKYPVRRIGGLVNDEHAGPTIMRACKYRPATTGASETLFDMHPELRGAANPDGFVTISGTDTEVRVLLPVAEIYATDYLVTPTLTSESSGSVTTRVTVTEQLAQSFVLTLDAAPGVGETVTVSYTLRRSTVGGAITAQRGIRQGAADTTVATAVGAGLVGSASGCWVGVTFWFRSVTPSTRVLVSTGEYNVAGNLLQIGNDESLLAASYGAGVNNAISTGADALVQGRCYAAMLVFDGSRTSLILNHRTYAPAGSAITLVPATAYRTRVGSYNPANDYPNLENPVFGVVGGVGVPTVLEIGEWMSAVARGLDPAPVIAGKTDHRWADMLGLADSVGSADLSLVSGTAPVIAALAPAYDI